eukprot:snap_masked-scaffold_2-processed-gene-21.24-mRNA-1 protein AED:0.04 eAED:0.04 QI:0/-1/0/1/-1/1/1/0/229
MKHSSIFLIALFSFIFLCAADPVSEGKAFLEENAKKPGVVTLPSGLQYKVLKSGSGEFHPTKNSPCTCHYHGTLIDGTVFDSSVERGSPIDFAPNQVIKGWTEAMQLMVEGDKFELYIPSDLAYGARGSPPKIPGGSTLVFTIEMIKIKGEKLPAAKCDVVTKDRCSEKEVEYLEKKEGLSVEALLKEIDRLQNVQSSSGKMKDSLSEWFGQRLLLLGKLIHSKGKEEL